MPDTLRHINMGSVSPVMWPAIWEYSRGYSGEIKPSLFSFQLDRNCLVVPPPYPLEDMLNVDQLPKDMYIIRFLNIPAPPFEWAYVYFGNSDMLFLYLHLPTNIKHSFADKCLRLSLIEFLMERHISCFLRKNDSFISVGNKEKKFGGGGYQDWPSGWTSYDQLVTLSIDTKLLDKYVRRDAVFLLKKQSQETFGDFVGGLNELDSNLRPDTIIEPFISHLSRRLGTNIVKGQLDTEETKYLNELSVALDKPSWRIQSIHPDLGDLK